MNHSQNMPGTWAYLWEYQDKYLCIYAHCAVLSRSVMSNSLQSHGLWPTRLLCPWDSPGKNTHTQSILWPLQEIFPKQGSNPGLSHCRRFLTLWATREAHIYAHIALNIHHSVYDTTTVYSWKETTLATKKESFLKQEKLMIMKKQLGTNNNTKK